jgi:hypothetical protein
VAAWKSIHPQRMPLVRCDLDVGALVFGALAVEGFPRLLQNVRLAWGGIVLFNSMVHFALPLPVWVGVQPGGGAPWSGGTQFA